MYAFRHVIQNLYNILFEKYKYLKVFIHFFFSLVQFFSNNVLKLKSWFQLSPKCDAHLLFFAKIQKFWIHTNQNKIYLGKQWMWVYSATLKLIKKNILFFTNFYSRKWTKHAQMYIYIYNMQLFSKRFQIKHLFVK